MLNIDLFREDKGGNPDLVRESQRRRFADVTLVDRVVEFDESWRKSRGAVDRHRRDWNVVKKLIGTKYIEMKKTGDRTVIGDPATATLPPDFLTPDNLTAVFARPRDGTDPTNPLVTFTVAELNLLKDHIQTVIIPAEEEKMRTYERERDTNLHQIGNIVSDKSVVSNDEADNGLVREWCPDGVELEVEGETAGEGEGKYRYNHVNLMLMTGCMDCHRGSQVAGARGYFMMGDAVRLNYALIQYGLAYLKERGHRAMYPPFFMKQDMMARVAQLDDFDEMLYTVTGDKEFDADGQIVGDKDPCYLIATSEQPICGFHYQTWNDAGALPYLYAGMSTNFRKEVGSHGKDTLGIFRVHQFDKIEQFAVTSPHDDASWQMFDQICGNAEEFYKSLKIPYRVVNIVSGKLNNAAALKYDIEGWFPASRTYRELVSCSNCTDYQSRRLEARYGMTKVGDVKDYVHMLNSTLCATTRCICIIFEHYQTTEGIRIPDVLVPYMGGQEFIPFVMEEPPAAKRVRKRGGQ